MLNKIHDKNNFKYETHWPSGLKGNALNPGICGLCLITPNRSAYQSWESCSLQISALT